VAQVLVDAERGPQVYQADGTIGFVDFTQHGARWADVPTADQKLLVARAARNNRRMLERKGRAFWHPEERQSPEERVRARCKREMEKPPVRWEGIGAETVKRNHGLRAPGMIYGLEFPWTEEMLESFGPEWLTKAFRAAGTMEEDNRVTGLALERSVKVTGGNNAGKFLFEVTYARPSDGLHTQLFAKVPFAMSKETQTDRISSSVMKQPMDLMEINTYRLLEAALPVATPRFYYGDISNATSNFLLVTARIPFAELGGARGRALGPFEVEGPYNKCKDWELRGDAREYYMLLVAASARMAGRHKAGGMGSEAFLAASSFDHLAGRPLEAWGMNPSGPSGEEPTGCQGRLEAAWRFASRTPRAIFQARVDEDSLRERFMSTMMKFNAYVTEIEFWKSCDPDYVALQHQNLNSDNAYFWRDEAGTLDCGVIDWGGFSAGCVGHKLWWCFNCAEFEQVRDNLPDYLDTFILAYQESGGPKLEKEKLRRMVLLTALGNIMFMVKAVPNCFTMCSAESFATVTDRRDPRVSEDVHGKSTLRTTLHVLDSGLRVLDELRVDEVLDTWIQEVYVGQWGLAAKAEALIHGMG